MEAKIVGWLVVEWMLVLATYLNNIVMLKVMNITAHVYSLLCCVKLFSVMTDSDDCCC